MARATDSAGYPNTRRAPPAGGNPATAAQQRAASRVNQYGTQNPYANSTNQNPYVGIAWLGSGFPHPLPSVPPQVPIDPPFLPLQYAASRPSYDLAGIAALLGPYWHIPIKVDYNVLWKIRETIPMISAAILRLKELVGFPEIQAKPEVKREIDQFLKNLPVNRMQTGAEIWAQSHLDNMFTYGRAHAEAVLTNARNDVFGLVEVHPTTVGLRPTFGGYAVHVVQYQYGGGVPVTLIPELLLSSVNDIRGDDPNGTSLIAELPFVSQILNSMLRSVGNTWDRFGSPTYWINWEPPEHWEDPTGKQSTAILSGMQGNLMNSLRERKEGLANDFFTTGKVTVQILGAQGDTLEFAQSGRAIMEQIAARFGLPPFMYGFSWASTERMSTAQAKMVTEIIESLRTVISPAIEKLINLHMLLSGKRADFSLDWPKVSLQDLIDVARADLMDAQAEQTALANWDRRVRLGINSIEEMACNFRDDLKGIPEKEIRLRLPDLVTELPDFLPAPLGGEAIAPASAAPGQDRTRDPERPPGGLPRAEVTRSVLEFALHGEDRTPTLTNGNGREH